MELKSITFILLVLATSSLAQSVNAPCTFTTNVRGYVCQFRNVNLGENETLNIVTDHDGVLTDADVIEVDFYFSRINYVPNQIFSRFINLRSLRMNAAYVQTIRSDSFVGASSLSDFSSVFNAINHLPARVFEGAPNLTEITLVFNDIVEIDENAFSGLSNLVLLNLDQNDIVSLAPQTFAPLTSLQFLSLANNNIERLPANLFSTLSQLTNILLFGNQMEEVHIDAFNGLTNLDNLEISRNRLTRIDARLFNATRLLRVLHLNQNRIEAIQSTFIQNLNNLDYLNLMGNECIDEEFENVNTNREALLSSLERCFTAFAPGNVRRFHMRMEGSLELTEL